MPNNTTKSTYMRYTLEYSYELFFFLMTLTLNLKHKLNQDLVNLFSLIHKN